MSEAPLRLHFAAISDVGRVRKDNQDSGYAGPWLLTVCDGVGGAARGDIASSTAVEQLRRLDEPPTDDLLGQVAGALHRAHDRIGELVDDDPSLSGTSTTATVALFDGHRIGVGHVGDSRAYLLRTATLTQLTSDHTFVQSLIDEGRITEEEARSHPHRNLILKALDGVHETEPDLFHVDLAAGDRLLLCSDGASGVLSDERMADILGTGTPEYAAVELVRASLDAGSNDNVTCVVADVLDVSPGTAGGGPDGPGGATGGADPDDTVGATTGTKTSIDTLDAEPLLVGAAAELSRRTGRGGRGLFRGHRAGDTGELEPIPADIPEDIAFAIPKDPIYDPEEMRYAPQPPMRFAWVRRICVLFMGLGLLAMVAGGFYWWTQQQYYLGEDHGHVAIFRGIPDAVPLVTLSRVYQSSDLSLDRLEEADRMAVEEGIDAADLEDAIEKFDHLADNADRSEPAADEDPADEPTDEPSTDTSAPSTDTAGEPQSDPGRGPSADEPGGGQAQDPTGGGEAESGSGTNASNLGGAVRFVAPTSVSRSSGPPPSTSTAG